MYVPILLTVFLQERSRDGSPSSESHDGTARDPLRLGHVPPRLLLVHITNSSPSLHGFFQLSDFPTLSDLSTFTSLFVFISPAQDCSKCLSQVCGETKKHFNFLPSTSRINCAYLPFIQAETKLWNCVKMEQQCARFNIIKHSDAKSEFSAN